MRFASAAATLAVLALAAPAAAQPNALEVVRGVATQLERNTEGVRDYTLTLRAGPMSTDIYVYRDGDEWEVASNDEEQLGEMMEGLVVWPNTGHADGINGDLVMLAPPFVITEDQIDELTRSLGRALTRVAERLGATR